MKEKVNVYQMVTDRVIEQLEKGIVPWQKPWSGAGLADGGAINYVSRKPYSFLNQMLLGREGEYLTFKQIKSLGGNIKKGAKAGIVVFFTMTTQGKKKDIDEDGNEIITEVINMHSYPILKYYHVFHIDDCEGIESKIKEIEPDDTLKPIEKAENIINGYLSREKKLKFQNDKPSGDAYYSPSQDMVVVPMLAQYQIVEEYYSTTFHERPTQRCPNTDATARMRWGSQLSEVNHTRKRNWLRSSDSEKAFRNSVAYIHGWLGKLKNDNKMIIWAASKAEKAAKYIMGIK